jgi:predicted nucleic acid-binding protein
MDKHHVVGVPSLVIFEVCRKVTARVSDDEALRVAAWLRTFGILNLTDEIALHAVDLSLTHKLGMADSVVLAHAARENAQLVTLDNDFATVKDAVIIRT